MVEEQCGFRKGRNCTDAIFTVQQIMEKRKERNLPLYIHTYIYADIHTYILTIIPSIQSLHILAIEYGKCQIEQYN